MQLLHRGLEEVTVVEVERLGRLVAAMHQDRRCADALTEPEPSKERVAQDAITYEELADPARQLPFEIRVRGSTAAPGGRTPSS